MKTINGDTSNGLFKPLVLPCGVVLKNRIIKSAMSDSLGDGRGNPTAAQLRLYERWAEGGVAASIIGEVQCTPNYAEKPGNLVLHPNSDPKIFELLSKKGTANGSQLWLQLGHAGAMAHPPISTPKGPSAIDIPGLRCAALTIKEIQNLPAEFARTAKLAQQYGFGGVQIHAAHGFLLSQFLSPLFNKRIDDYGGSAVSRMRLLLEVVEEVRSSVDSSFVVGVKLNATDQLDGGFEECEALKVVSALDGTGIDFIDISGGTYFPGAKSSSDSTGSGPYFMEFASQARQKTSKPIMLTGGFKTKQQATDAMLLGEIDLIGMARALVIDPALPESWSDPHTNDPVFPRFNSRLEGGVTAWYTMRLADLGKDRASEDNQDLERVLQDYNDRDEERVLEWIDQFQ
ncbi:MAG: hypothetical protein KTR18_12780 [Acidiferrobacterales bacterium]|nr:hypothetical protein [Acidiferrobacterales bacterium]